VIVEAKIGGKKAEAHWSFHLKELSANPSGTPAASPQPSPKK
jgi:hypothetical protein